MNDRMARTGWLLIPIFCLLPFVPLLALAAPQTQAPAKFQLEEATIASVHAAMKAKQMTCHNLVDQYLKGN